MTTSHRQALSLDERRANFVPSLWEHDKTITEDDPKRDLYRQDVREVWFRGEHCDIGGGAPFPLTRVKGAPFTALSNIPLRWMVQQCLECDTGIIFDHNTAETFRKCNVLEARPQPQIKDRLDEAYYRKIYQGSTALDKIDIQHEPYESMGQHSFWNLLEFWPSRRQVQTEAGTSKTYACVGFIFAFWLVLMSQQT